MWKSGRSTVRRDVASAQIISAFALAAVLTTTGIAIPHVAHAVFITSGGEAKGGVSQLDGIGIMVSGGSGGIGGGGSRAAFSILVGTAPSPGGTGGPTTGGAGGIFMQSISDRGGNIGCISSSCFGGSASIFGGNGASGNTGVCFSGGGGGGVDMLGPVSNFVFKA